VTGNLQLLCIASSARSQIAEGLARHRFGEAAQIKSAGSQPTALNPLAVEAMAEIGIEIFRQRAKARDEIDFGQVDTVVTLCAEEVCLVVPDSAQRLQCPIPDPATPRPALPHDEKLSRFRPARDSIKGRRTT